MAGWSLVVMEWLVAPSHSSPYDEYALAVFACAVFPPVFLFIGDLKALCRLILVAAACAFLAACGCTTSMTIDRRLSGALTNPLAFPPTCVAIATAAGIVIGIWYPEVLRGIRWVVRSRHRELGDEQ